MRATCYLHSGRTCDCSKSLVEAKKWCFDKLCNDRLIARSLRTVNLLSTSSLNLIRNNRMPGDGPADSICPWDDSWSYFAGSVALKQLPNIVSEVCETRQKALAPNELQRHNYQGHLLITHYELWQGWRLAERESNGFFDATECSPWDTWIGIIRFQQISGIRPSHLALVSWVPIEAMDIVSRGIDADPTKPMYWLEASSIIAPDEAVEIKAIFGLDC